MEPCSLRNKRFQSSYSAKVGAEAIKNGRGGEGRRGNLLSPPPPPSFLFFVLLLSQRSRRTRAESLATQARNPVKTKIAVQAGVCKMFTILHLFLIWRILKRLSNMLCI